MVFDLDIYKKMCVPICDFIQLGEGKKKRKTKQCKTLVVFAKVVNLYY